MSGAYHLQQYKRASVNASQPDEVLLMLVNEAVRAAEAARLEQEDLQRRILLNKSRRIVGELSDSLNMDLAGESGLTLLRIYSFINSRLADALLGNLESLPDALRVLRHVRDTWVEAVRLSREGK